MNCVTLRPNKSLLGRPSQLDSLMLGANRTFTLVRVNKTKYKFLD